ncbi:MAG TPA: hypothetical protein V6D05_12495 [Stenomitos sp.]
MSRKFALGALLSTTLVIGSALPALAGSGPRSDITAGHLGLGFDPGAFSVDLGLTDHLTLGVDARDYYPGTAWSGFGAHATYRLLGKNDGWNLAIGGRVSVPNSQVDALGDTRLNALPSTVGSMGTATGYVLLSLPLTNWFILRYPIGFTYYLGSEQNGGTPWMFGTSSWSPNDGRTVAIDTPSSTIYLPMMQLLPEAAFKFWGLEATLFGTSIAGMRLTF